MDITVGPPGECLENLITLNVITLLDLWMDVSVSLIALLPFHLPLTHTYCTHTLTLPPATITTLPIGVALWKDDRGCVSRALESCYRQPFRSKASYNTHADAVLLLIYFIRVTEIVTLYLSIQRKLEEYLEQTFKTLKSVGANIFFLHAHLSILQTVTGRSSY